MHSANNMIISHDKIIDVMARIGYEGVKDGICNGLTHMWIQAVLCKQADKFLHRLHFICSEPHLLKKITTAKAKRGQNLTDEDIDCLEVLAFFDGVQIYQNFKLFAHLLDPTPPCLDAATISTLTRPILLDKHPIVEIFSENRLFNTFNLQGYLSELASEFEYYTKSCKALEKVDEHPPELIITLHSCSHKIALRYKHSNASAYWELTDANQYPPIDLPHYAAAPAVLQSLTEGSFTATNVGIFTTANNPLKSVVQHTLTNSKKLNVTASAPNFEIRLKQKQLLALAAMRGDEKIFSSLAKDIPSSDLWEYISNASKTALISRQSRITNIILDQYPYCFMRATDTQEILSVVITTRQNNLIAHVIHQGADADESYHGQRPLHIAISAGNLDAVKELIALNANVGLENIDGDPAIFHAIKLHQINIIQYLCESKKVNLKAKNSRGDTVLTVAVDNNSSAACNILLTHKANPNKRNSLWETPAFLACRLGYKDCLVTLMKHQANLSLYNQSGSTPLFIALIKQNWDIVATILLHLKSLSSFNPFSYQLTINHLGDVIHSAAEQIQILNNDEKSRIKEDIKHHRNALSLMLMKKQNHDLCFFKPKEKHLKAYKREIRAACTPITATDIKQHDQFVRI